MKWEIDRYNVVVWSAAVLFSLAFWGGVYVALSQ